MLKNSIQSVLTEIGIVLSANNKKLLISIKGISVLTALAFLSDVSDVTRFKTTRKMNAYLDLVPRLKQIGDKAKSGHINSASRKTTRTILTHSLVQAMFASPYLNSFY